MATPNNLTPTNCSWWPISALESDAAKPVEAPDAPEAASPAHWPKESLVLYHWTQSFSSQKVERARGADRRLGGDRGEEQVARGFRRELSCLAAEPSPNSRSISLGLVPSWGHLNRETKARDRQALPASGLMRLSRGSLAWVSLQPIRCPRHSEPAEHSLQALILAGVWKACRLRSPFP